MAKIASQNTTTSIDSDYKVTVIKLREKDAIKDNCETILERGYMTLECAHDYPKVETTLHGFSHYTGRTPDEIRGYMEEFFVKQTHRDWIQFIGGAFLYRKGLSLDEYLHNIVSPNVPLDELGLMIMARMYHEHVAMITKDYTWTSGWNLVVEDCRFIFTYAGGLEFHMVCDKPPGFKPPQKCPLNLSKSKTSRGTRSKTRRGTAKKPKPQLSIGRKRKCRSSRIITVPLPFSYVTKKDKRQTKTSKKASSNVPKLTLNSVLKRNRDRKHYAAPTNLKETDPIAGHLSNRSDLEDPKSDHLSEYQTEDESKQNVETIKTDAGQIKIKKHGLKRPERKVKKISCPICNQIIFTQQRMNVHMKEQHPTFKFQCALCEDLYTTYNAAYRHTQTHFKLHYLCDICGHRSQYPGGMKCHMQTHTKKELIPCTWRGCQKKFTSRKSMWQHLQAHGPDSWKCDPCNKSFDTYSNFRQHNKGLHGTGWRARCGFLCQWPYIRSKHQRNCDKCKDIKQKQENKPDNPRRFTRRKLAKFTPETPVDPSATEQ